jgi:hypothetical protein
VAAAAEAFPSNPAPSYSDDNRGVPFALEAAAGSQQPQRLDGNHCSMKKDMIDGKKGKGSHDGEDEKNEVFRQIEVKGEDEVLSVEVKGCS